MERGGDFCSLGERNHNFHFTASEGQAAQRGRGEEKRGQACSPVFSLQNQAARSGLATRQIGEYVRRKEGEKRKEEKSGHLPSSAHKRREGGMEP